MNPEDSTVHLDTSGQLLTVTVVGQGKEERGEERGSHHHPKHQTGKNCPCLGAVQTVGKLKVWLFDSVCMLQPACQSILRQNTAPPTITCVWTMSGSLCQLWISGCEWMNVTGCGFVKFLRVIKTRKETTTTYYHAELLSISFIQRLLPP